MSICGTNGFSFDGTVFLARQTYSRTFSSTQCLSYDVTFVDAYVCRWQTYSITDCDADVLSFGESIFGAVISARHANTCSKCVAVRCSVVESYVCAIVCHGKSYTST